MHCHPPLPGIQTTLALPYDTVLAKLPDELKSEGFGVLTQIDVRDTLREKLGVEFTRYKILGACNPTLVHRALPDWKRLQLTRASSPCPAAALHSLAWPACGSRPPTRQQPRRQ